MTGPFDRAQWVTLLELKKWINWYKENNNQGKFNSRLERDRKAYKDILSKAA